MALKLNLLQSNVGMPFEQAYAKITAFHGNLERTMYDVRVYASQDARHVDYAREVALFGFHVEGPITKPLFEALYENLKTQPGFESAEDC